MQDKGPGAEDRIIRATHGADEKTCFLVLLALFLILSISITLIPYDPSVDLADATTNDIWVDYYSHGVYHIPYSEWHFNRTQSVVVNYSGEYVVVNEKGPGHVMMIVPFHVLGIEFLFEPFMVAIAVFSTYMLGKRLANWRVGFVSSVFALTNVTVLVMWYRYYWTDASTMHLLALSFWLLVESNYWLNGRSLNPKKLLVPNRNQTILGIATGVLSGLSFGASVSTRYATALIIFAVAAYIGAFYLLRVWPDLRAGRILKTLKGSSRMWPLLFTFVLGLMVILVPLMQYNSRYFGSPFASGYDQILVFQFNGNNTGATTRDTSGSWSSDFGSMMSNALGNFVAIAPVLISRMPGLILLPVAAWLLRRRIDTWFLFLWTTINFFTYLSISWVDMYANMPAGNLHEPRYWMPSVPPIALMAGVSFDRGISWAVGHIRRAREVAKRTARISDVALTLAVVSLVASCGIVPAAGYFSHLEPGGALDPGGQGPPPPNPPPKTGVLADNVMGMPSICSRYLLITEYGGWDDARTRNGGAR